MEGTEKRRRGARRRGFLEGYRDGVVGVGLRITHPNKRWMKGFEEGRRAADADLKARVRGPFELPYMLVLDHKAALHKAHREADVVASHLLKRLDEVREERDAFATGKLPPDHPIIKAQDAKADCGCESDGLPSDGQGGER